MLGACERPMVIKACGSNPMLEVYTDASYQIHNDSRSHSCVIVFFGDGGASVHGTSGKQPRVTRSTCDSEIVTFEAGTYVGSYFHDVLVELGVKIKMVLHWEDNEAALHLVKNGCHEYTKKRKHIVGMIHSAKECFDDGDNDAVAMHCVTEMMVADIGTKDLHGRAFEDHRASLHGEEEELD